MQNKSFFFRQPQKNAENFPAIVPAQANEIIEAEAVECFDTGNLFSWDVQPATIFDRYGRQLTGWKSLDRTDTCESIHIARDSYTPTTNARFSEAVQRLANYTGFSIAGTSELNEGRKVMAWLKGERADIAGFSNDRYMLIGNSHDGSSAFFFGHTHNMIRCANQFTQLDKKMKAYHTSTNSDQIRLMEENFRTFQQHEVRLKSYFEKFAGQKIEKRDRAALIRAIFDIDENCAPDELSAQRQNQILALNQAIERERLDIGDNALMLFHAVTYYTTHIRKQKERAFGNAHGSVYDLNRRAFEFCAELTK